MRVEIIKEPTDKDWLHARNSALITQRKEATTSPNSYQKIRLIASEHSPIRELTISWNSK